MKEKKEIKVSLTTVILLFLVFILVVSFGIMWCYYNHIHNSNNSTNTSQQVNLNNNTNILNQENEKEENAKYVDYSKDTTPVENGYHEKIDASNTINYALLKKYGYNEDIFVKYYSKGLAAGDSPNYEIIESNYENNLGKYTEPITFNMAMVKDYLYPTNNDTLVNNLKVFKPLLLKERSGYNSESELYVSLNGLSIMNGNNKSPEAYNNNSRAKKVQVTINDTSKYVFELKDTNEVQLFNLNYKQTDIGTPITVKIEVLETYKGLVSDDIYMNEIGFGLEENGFGGR